MDNETIEIRDDLIHDLINITSGAYAPLTGFMGSRDTARVLREMKTERDAIWSIPIVLDIDEEQRERIKNKTGMYPHD